MLGTGDLIDSLRSDGLLATRLSCAAAADCEYESL